MPKKLPTPSAAPQVYFVEDSYAGRYRVGRTDEPGDYFHLVDPVQFKAFREVYEGLLGMPLLDKTDN